MTNLFKDTEGKMSRHWQLNIFLFINAQKIEQNSCADLVVEKAGLDEACLSNRGTRVEGNKITDFDS